MHLLSLSTLHVRRTNGMQEITQSRFTRKNRAIEETKGDITKETDNEHCQ